MKTKKTPKSAVQTVDKLYTVHLTLLCGIVFLSPLIAGRMFPIPELGIQALVFAAVLVWLYRLIKRGTADLPGKIIPILASVFTALLLLSMVDSVSLHRSIREYLNISSYLLMFMMIIDLSSNREAVIKVVASLGVSAMIVGALGIRQYAEAFRAGDVGWRTFATFFNPDFLAGFMVLIFPIALAWFLSRASSAASVLSGLAVLFIFANILTSGSRLGSLAVVGGLSLFIVLGIASRTIGKAQLLRLMILLIPAIIIFSLAGRPLAGRVTASSTKAEAHSGGFRIHTWKGTARMAATHPVNGTGLGTFEVAYPKYALVGYTKLAHNSYIQLAGEAGTASAVVLLALLSFSTISVASVIIKKRWTGIEAVDGKNSPDMQWMPDTGLLLCGLVSGVAASMARNAVDSDWYITAIGISFWAVLGMAVGLGCAGRQLKIKIGKNAGYLGMGLVAVVLAGALLMIAAENTANRGDRAFADQDFESALEYYSSAAKLDPLNAEYQRSLGSTYLNLAASLRDASYAERAGRVLVECILLEPTSAKFRYQLGRADEYLSRNYQAILAYREALELDPNSPQIMLALARVYEDAGGKDEALAVYKRMVEVENSPYEQIRAVPELVEPAYIFAHRAIGEAMEARGDKAKAVEEYRTALKRIERYQTSIENMGQVLDVNQQRNPEMEAQVEEIRVKLVAKLGKK